MSDILIIKKARKGTRFKEEEFKHLKWYQIYYCIIPGATASAIAWSDAAVHGWPVISTTTVDDLKNYLSSLFGPTNYKIKFVPRYSNSGTVYISLPNPADEAALILSFSGGVEIDDISHQ